VNEEVRLKKEEKGKKRKKTGLTRSALLAMSDWRVSGLYRQVVPSLAAVWESDGESSGAGRVGRAYSR
jgi:hypothetical protein